MAVREVREIVREVLGLFWVHCFVERGRGKGDRWVWGAFEVSETFRVVDVL